MSQPVWLRIEGARQNNLKNVSVDIPHDRLTVITGVSGSGKSSLAFDTLFAEGRAPRPSCTTTSASSSPRSAGSTARPAGPRRGATPPTRWPTPCCAITRAPGG